MRPHLLLTTTALALALGMASAQAQSRGDRNGMQNGGIQNGQSSPSMQGLDQRGAMPSRAGSPHEETTGQSRSPSMNSQDEPNASDSDRGADMDRMQTGRDRNGTSPSNAAKERGRTSGEGNAAEQNEPGKSSAAESEKRTRSRASKKNENKGSARTERNRTESADHRRTEERHRNKAEERNDNKAAESAHTRGRERDRADRNRSSHESNGAAERSNTGHERAASHTKHGERLSTSLKSSQKTQLASAISRIDVRPIARVNFSVSVGTVVPSTVVLHPVPEAIVDIIPEYRDYEFFAVRDEIVIVQPRTHRIVDVIERGGPARAEVTTTTTRRKIRLSDRDREVIRRDVSRGHVTTGAGTETKIIVGEELPDSVEIQSFPEEIYEEVPAIRSYRYVERGPNVYLVDPDSRRVIEEIE